MTTWVSVTGMLSDDPTGWWQGLAGELAGSPQVLIGRWRPGADGGRVEYDSVRALTPALPVEPAAVRVYSDAGMCRALWLDFDPKRAAGGATAVLRDATAAAELLAGHGALVLVDETARGGRHVIAPLAVPTSKRDLEPVVRALAALYPTLDTGPMLAIARGCMAPPGAVTRRGEVRQLLTPFGEALQAVSRRSASGLLDALRAVLVPAAEVPDLVAGVLVDERAQAVPGAVRRALPALARGIVERGVFPPARYKSGSEARQGALVAAACRGWSLADVHQRLSTGDWPGLARLYAKYGASWAKYLAADWAKALLYAARQPSTPAVAQDHTRGRTSSRGGRPDPSSAVAKSPAAVPGGHSGNLQDHFSRAEYRWLRRAYGTLLLVASVFARDEAGRTRLAVLLAILSHAQRTGSRIVSPGTRSLTLSAGLMGHSEIAAVLRAERDAVDGWVRLMEAHRGDRADRYEIVIPDRYAGLWDGRALPVGRIEGVHPVFAPGLLGPGMGLAAWQVIEAVAGGANTVPQLVEATGVSRAQVYRVLRAGRAAGLLAQRVDGTWRRTRRSYDRAGRHVGLPDRVAQRREGYAIERRLWRVWLAERGRGDWRALGYRLVAGGTATPDDVAPLWLPGWQHQGPPDDGDPPSATDAAIALLQTVFDAELLDVVPAALATA